MEFLTFVHLMCLTLSQPGYYLNETRKKTVCNHSALVYQESKKNNIDPILLMSLIYAESGWKKNAVSYAGACGLTQVLPKYTGKYSPVHKKYSCRQLKNPRTSIIVGAKIFSYWLHSYAKGNIRVALCGYNAGFRCKGKNPNKSGMKYARRVLKIKKKINKSIEDHEQNNIHYCE